MKRKHGFVELPGNWVVVDCAGCKCLLRVHPEKLPGGARSYEVAALAGRIKGKPYCGGCLRVADVCVSGLGGGAAPIWNREGDGGPWGENAQRAREDQDG